MPVSGQRIVEDPCPVLARAGSKKCICDSIHKLQIQNPVGFSAVTKRIDFGVR